MENVIVIELKIYQKGKQTRNVEIAEIATDEELDSICGLTSHEIFDAIKTKPIPCSWSNAKR